MIVMSRCHVRRGGTTRGSFRNKSLSTCLRCAVVLKCGQLASRGSASELFARIQLEMHPLRELGASVQQNQCNSLATFQGCQRSYVAVCASDTLHHHRHGYVPDRPGFSMLVLRGCLHILACGIVRSASRNMAHEGRGWFVFFKELSCRLFRDGDDF